jgi:hypothetical protein
MDGSAADLADTVRGLLRERTMVETSDPAAEERLVLIASAGDGWLMVADRLEKPTASFDDPDGLIAELNASHAGMAIEVSIADSDDLVLRLIEHGHEQSQLALDTRGRLDGHLQPWQRVLMAERTVDDLRAALAKQTTFVEEHLSEMETLLGLDLGILAGKPPAPGAVALRFRAAPAPGQTIGPPVLKVDQSQREITIRNKDFLQIPLERSIAAICLLLTLGQTGRTLLCTSADRVDQLATGFGPRIRSENVLRSSCVGSSGAKHHSMSRKVALGRRSIPSVLPRGLTIATRSSAARSSINVLRLGPSQRWSATARR